MADVDAINLEVIRGMVQSRLAASTKNQAKKSPLPFWSGGGRPAFWFLDPVSILPLSPLSPLSSPNQAVAQALRLPIRSMIRYQLKKLRQIYHRITLLWKIIKSQNVRDKSKIW